MVLAELARALERLWALDTEHSDLSTTIDLMCGRLGVSQSGKKSSRAPRMTLITDCIREMEVVTYWLRVHHALVVVRPLG